MPFLLRSGIAAALAAFAALAGAVPGTAAKSPHVLLVVADDYGWNDVGYHQSNATTNVALKTPTLDRLASEGRKLERYYVQPLCSPTRGKSESLVVVDPRSGSTTCPPSLVMATQRAVPTLLARALVRSGEEARAIDRQLTLP